MLQCIFMCFLFPAGLFLLRGIFGPVNALFFSFFFLVKQQSKSLCLCAVVKNTNICPVCYWVAPWAYFSASSLVVISSLNKGFYKQMHISKSVHQYNCSFKPAFAKSRILGMCFKDKASVILFMQRKRFFFLASGQK